MATTDDCAGHTRTRKLGVTCKAKFVTFRHKCSVTFELFTHFQDIAEIVFRRGPVTCYSFRICKNYKTFRGALSMCNRAFNFARQPELYTTGNSVEDWRE